MSCAPAGSDRTTAELRYAARGPQIVVAILFRKSPRRLKGWRTWWRNCQILALK